MGVGLAMNRFEKDIPPSFEGFEDAELNVVGVVKNMLLFDYKQRISLNRAQILIGDAFVALKEQKQTKPESNNKGKMKKKKHRFSFCLFLYTFVNHLFVCTLQVLFTGLIFTLYTFVNHLFVFTLQVVFTGFIFTLTNFKEF